VLSCFWHWWWIRGTVNSTGILSCRISVQLLWRSVPCKDIIQVVVAALWNYRKLNSYSTFCPRHYFTLPHTLRMECETVAATALSREWRAVFWYVFFMLIDNRNGSMEPPQPHSPESFLNLTSSSSFPSCKPGSHCSALLACLTADLTSRELRGRLQNSCDGTQEER
jgi:hypothetical protein